MDSETLFDTLSGAAGAPVNRAGLNNFVATSQAMNGLRSAQTEEALLKAQKARDEMEQSSQLERKLSDLLGPGHGAEAAAATGLLRSNKGDASNVAESLLRFQQLGNRDTLGDASLLGSPLQTAAQQAVKGEVALPTAVPETYSVLPGQAAPNVMQTPQGEAHTAETNAQAKLHNRMADDPQLYHPVSAKAGALGLSPEEGAALDKAIGEGRLDPARVNSRTAGIFAGIEMRTPGMNFNRLTADANLQKSPGFQQKAMAVEMLPGVLTHLVDLGKKVGYSDLKTAGRIQQWMKGEVNDPALAEYVPVRNDALLRLAGVMRQVGMSDQAHQAEIEAMAPTLSPYALDAWLKGQMSVIKPLLEQQRKITQHGEVKPTDAPGVTPPAGGDMIPPEAIPHLKEGIPTTFQNGQTWTLEGGKPKRVK